MYAAASLYRVHFTPRRRSIPIEHTYTGWYTLYTHHRWEFLLVDHAICVDPVPCTPHPPPMDHFEKEERIKKREWEREREKRLERGGAKSRWRKKKETRRDFLTTTRLICPWIIACRRENAMTRLLKRGKTSCGNFIGTFDFSFAFLFIFSPVYFYFACFFLSADE